MTAHVWVPAGLAATAGGHAVWLLGGRGDGTNKNRDYGEAGRVARKIVEGPSIEDIVSLEAGCEATATRL